MGFLQFIWDVLAIGIYRFFTGLAALALGLLSLLPWSRRRSGEAGFTSSGRRLALDSDAAFAELIEDATNAGLDTERLVSARRVSIATVDAALDDMSLEVARRFVAGDLSFKDGDWVMNSAWSYWVGHSDRHERLPILGEVYFAFDESEDPLADGSDPVRDRTLPMLEAVLHANESRKASAGAGSA